jgi:hypothetical protein
LAGIGGFKLLQSLLNFVIDEWDLIMNAFAFRQKTHGYLPRKSCSRILRIVFFVGPHVQFGRVRVGTAAKGQNHKAFFIAGRWMR